MTSLTVRRLASIFGFLGVALGAFGAHALRARLAMLGTGAQWETAVIYQLVHAVVLLWLAGETLTRTWAVRLFSAGIVLFSGSLYLYAVTKQVWLTAPTPFGGLCFLAGWLWLFRVR